MVGNVGVGGDNPIRVQSMITCDTMDTAASIQQTLELAAVGCEIVRITAPTVKDAAQSASTSSQVCASAAATCRSWPTSISSPRPRWKRRSGWRKCASIRATTPTRRSSRSVEYTDEQYAAELERIRERFTPLVELVQGARRRHAHRHQSRLAHRPHHEPLRRHAARAWWRARWSSPASRATSTITTSSSR